MYPRCVLITGTVIPNVDIDGHETLDPSLRECEYRDIDVRRRRYLKTLAGYSSSVMLPMFFLENSRYDFERDSEFAKIFATGKIHLVKCPESNARARGKGYQEFEMLDSFVGVMAGKFDSFLKISGRYLFNNIERILDGPPESVWIDRWRRREVATTSIFLSTVSFYQKHIMGLFRDADDRDGAWIERQLYARLRTVVGHEAPELLPVEPVRQTWSEGGNRGGVMPRDRLRVGLRNAERKVLRAVGVREILL